MATSPTPETTFQNLQIVAGTVDASGNPTQSIGSFVSDYGEEDYDDSPLGQDKQGTYSISYGDGTKGSSPFTVPPVVVATVNYDDDSDTATRIATILKSDENGFIVFISSSKGNDKQQDFNFVAIAPQ